MKVVRALKYAQPVSILVFADTDVALRHRLTTAEFGRREWFCRQLVNITRLHPTRYVTHVLDQIQQMLTEQQKQQ